MLRKSDFQKAGGMDLRFHPGEEVDLLRRLHDSKKLLYYNPKMLVSRTRRKTVGDFVRQFVRYGKARGLIEFGTDVHGSDFVYFLPTLFLIYLFLLSLFPSALLAVPLLLYTIFAAIAACWIGWINRSLSLAACTFPLFFVLHLSYGAGVLSGAIQQLSGNPDPAGTHVSLTELQPAPQFNSVAEIKQ